MINVIVKSEDLGNGYKINTTIEGEGSIKEIKEVIISILKGFAESSDDLVVCNAMEKYVKERMNKYVKERMNK